MSRVLVQKILKEIDSLTDEERLSLDKQWAKGLEVQWELECANAQVGASRRGIDQATIDNAIERRRYLT
jgi:hypothetical protein